MTLLTRISIASVVASIPAILLAPPMLNQYLTGAFIPFGGDLVRWSFYFLLVVATPVELAAIVIATRARQRSLITAGHALCLLGLIAQFLMFIFPTTGLEPLFLPLALAPGQLVVLAGLICARRARA